MELSVREMHKGDLPQLLEYWYSSTDEHLLNMGVDLKKIPALKDLEEMLLQQLELPYEKKES
ncbi:MAG: N-acetyltransferase, partial [Flavobacteriaceae bacterium]|nr:N-acetyltransferase [Flavobacteriaceae bacterium]